MVHVIQNTKLNILNIYDFDFKRFSQKKHESGMFELADSGNQQSNKEVNWQKVFYVFWKYKNTKIKCI